MQTIEFDRGALRAQGLTDAAIDQGRADLEIILAAAARDPSSPVAVTEVADMVLHDAIERGLVVDHRPMSPEAPEYRAPWLRTVAAFAGRGIALDVDPTVKRTDGRGAITCLVSLKAA